MAPSTTSVSRCQSGCIISHVGGFMWTTIQWMVRRGNKMHVLSTLCWTGYFIWTCDGWSVCGWTLVTGSFFSGNYLSFFLSLFFFFFFFLPCAIVYIINNTCPAWWDDTNWMIWSMQLLISSYVHILKPPLASKIHSEVTVCSWQCIKIQERSANSTCQHTAWIQFLKNLFKSFHKSRKLVSYLNTSSGYCQGFVTPSQPQWLYWNDLLKGNGCLKTCFGQQVEKTKIKT